MGSFRHSNHGRDHRTGVARPGAGVEHYAGRTSVNDGPEGPPPTFESEWGNRRNLAHRAGRMSTSAHVERGPMAQPDTPVPVSVPVSLGYVAT